MNLHDRLVRSALGVLVAVWLGAAAGLVRPAEPAVGQSLQSFAVTVVAVLGADRLEVEVPGGDRDTVRLNGIEVRSCMEREALALTRLLASNEVVYLEPSSQPRNSDDDVPGYVWVDEGLLNVILVSEGLAVPSGLSNRYQKTLASAMEEARSRKRGGWGNSSCNW